MGLQRPNTPDVYKKQSRKEFAQSLSAWKVAVHAWDPPEAQQAFRDSKTAKEQASLTSTFIPQQVPEVVQIQP